MQEIHEVQPTSGSLIAAMFESPDYRDAFMVPSADWETVDDFARAYFLNQPRWLALVSMNLTSRDKLTAAIDATDFATGSAIGAWKVYARDSDEIVFGDDMGFMRYCFSMRLLPTGEVEAATAVKYQWKRTSHLYFSLVKPMHRRFVPISLRAALPPTLAQVLV